MVVQLPGVASRGLVWSKRPGRTAPSAQGVSLRDDYQLKTTPERSVNNLWAPLKGLSSLHGLEISLLAMKWSAGIEMAAASCVAT